MKPLRLSIIALLCSGLCVLPAGAWGTKGHTIISTLAATQFAGRMPSFLTTQAAIAQIGYLGPQLDRIKGAGTSWDADWDSGHFLDLLDDGKIADAVSASNMPADREAYDTALRSAGTDQYRQGYLPYEILDGWQQLREDFAYWRVDDYTATHGETASERAQAERDRDFVQAATVQDLGVWSHFVGDGSQPLHVTVHYNGWGKYPNPEHYSQSRQTHAEFESDFVDHFVTQNEVLAHVPTAGTLPIPTALLSQTEVMSAIMRYLRASNAAVPQLYQIKKRHGFSTGTPEAVDFAASRLGAGAAELRDLSVWAWQDSAYASVGYPAVKVADVLAGNADWPQRRK